MSNNEWKKVCAACAEGTPPARCAYYGDPNGCNAPTLGMHPEGDLAERLQEALEKAERRIAELERAPGNASALREALNRVERLANDLRNITERDTEVRADVNEIVDVCRAALAAPARNCDVYRDETKARAAWLEYCETDDLPRSSKTEGAFVPWLFDTAKGGAKCIDGLRGHPDCRGCNEHCEDVRKRNCFYWNPDIEGGLCALTGKKSCPISCDKFTTTTKAAPADNNNKEKNND